MAGMDVIRFGLFLTTSVQPLSSPRDDFDDKGAAGFGDKVGIDIFCLTLSFSGGLGDSEVKFLVVAGLDHPPEAGFGE